MRFTNLFIDSYDDKYVNIAYSKEDGNNDFFYGLRLKIDQDTNWLRLTREQSDWMKLKEIPWFLNDSSDIFKSFGLDTDNLNDIEYELSTYYYIYCAHDGTDEIFKWINGPIFAYLNAKSIPISKLTYVLPADYLKTFLIYMRENKFEKNFAKDIFKVLLDGGPQFFDPYVDWDTCDLEDDATLEKICRLIENDLQFRRLTGQEVLDEIITNPRFKSIAGDEVDSIISDILAANAEQASKLKEQPKLMGWFTGQIMKAAKGKADPRIIQNKLQAIIDEGN